MAEITPETSPTCPVSTDDQPPGDTNASSTDGNTLLHLMSAIEIEDSPLKSNLFHGAKKWFNNRLDKLKDKVSKR